MLTGTRATVTPNLINAVNTDLHLNLNLRTDLYPDDLVIVTLPQQVTVRYQASGSSNALNCDLLTPANTVLDIKSCEATSSQMIKLVLGSNLSYIVQLDVKGALTNPPSTTFTDSLTV
jgi:hypothetical protein